MRQGLASEFANRSCATSMDAGQAQDFRRVVRLQSAKISSWLCSTYPAEALAKLECEKRRFA